LLDGDIQIFQIFFSIPWKEYRVEGKGKSGWRLRFFFFFLSDA